MTNTNPSIDRMEHLLNQWIEQDPDAAERFMESLLARLALRRRLAEKRTAATPDAQPKVADLAADEHPYTYASTQATNCAGCGEYKHTPLRIDAMGGYVCLTCILHKLGGLLGEFGYPRPPDTQPKEN